MPLGARVFFICLLAVLLTAAGAVVALLVLDEPAPTEDRSERALEAGYSAFVTLERARYEQLALAAGVLADRPEVTGLLTASDEELPPEARGAALDTFNNRRWNLTLAVVQDAAGQTVLRTDDPLQSEDRVAMASASESPGPGGVWYGDGKLYQTVTVPILPPLAPPDAGIAGHLIVGRAVDDIWPEEIARIGQGEVAFLAGVQGGVQVVSKSLDARLVQPLLTALTDGGGGPSLFDSASRGEILARREVTLAGAPWVVRMAPLRGSGRDTMAAVALLSREPPPSGTGAWLRLAVVGGAALAALLLAAPLAWTAGRSGRGPLRKLAGVVEQARRGEAGSSQVRDAGRGATGEVTAALAGFLSDHEQRRMLRAAVRAAAAGGGEGGGAPAPERPGVALLGVDLRRHARATDPREALEQLKKDIGLLRRAVQAHGGGVQALLGHRVLAVFAGEAPARRALAAAAQAMKALTATKSAFDEVEPPTMAVASGRVVEGRLPEEDGRMQPVYLGLPAQLLETVLREAAPGEIFFSRDVHRDLGEAFEKAGIEPVAQNAMLTPQPLYALSADKAAVIAGGRPSEASSVEVSAVTAPGTVLDDRFEVRSLAGEGPVSVVYRAYDRELGREVAFKELRPGAVTSADRLTALDSPLQAYRGLAHPNVARLFDYGSLDNRLFVSREWVDGLPLAEVLRRLGRMAPVAALGAARQLAAALAAAHAQGLAHLRLKPGNVLFGPDGTVRVTDFGVAVIAPPLLDLEDGGGASWMAPEQEGGEAGDARSDVYTIGLLIHRLFAGAAAGESAALPEPITAIVSRCRASDPKARYADARELGQALETVVLG